MYVLADVDNIFGTQAHFTQFSFVVSVFIFVENLFFLCCRGENFNLTIVGYTTYK